MNRTQKNDLIARVLAGEATGEDRERFAREYQRNWFFRFSAKRQNRKANAARELSAVLSALQQDGPPIGEEEVGSLTAAMFDRAATQPADGRFSADATTVYRAPEPKSAPVARTATTSPTMSPRLGNSRVSARSEEIAEAFVSAGTEKLRNICAADGNLEEFEILQPYLIPADGNDLWARARERVAMQLGLTTEATDAQLASFRNVLNDVLREAMNRRGGSNTIIGYDAGRAGLG